MENNDDVECDRPEWVNQITNRILDDFESGCVSIDIVEPAITGMSLIEMDPLPVPSVSYFKNEIMFSWSSPKGTLSVISWTPGGYLVWLSRNGCVIKKWEQTSISGLRKLLVQLFVTVEARWNSR